MNKRKTEIIDAVSKNHNIKLAGLTLTEAAEYAKSFPNTDEWFKGKEVDLLSKEEAGIIAHNTIIEYKKKVLLNHRMKNSFKEILKRYTKICSFQSPLTMT
ncbi:hypothetical protein ACQ86N_22585 [Puia sp. P3]|uniref:hypothetical protein n=1 Tax=Puia sp. P3 TaxID=3423952 RepID=UPI003D673C47